MLRALGASRAQIRRSVLVEAFITGAVGSLLGLLGGIGLAFLLIAALKAVGLDLPSTVPVIKPRTIILSVGVGLVVTMVSAFMPSWRASRVLPIAAIREVALETGKRSPVRWIIGGLFLVLGAFGVGTGASSNTASSILLGIISLFIGVVVVGPRIAGPITGRPRVPGAEGRGPHREDGAGQRHPEPPPHLGHRRRDRPHADARVGHHDLLLLVHRVDQRLGGQGPQGRPRGRVPVVRLRRPQPRAGRAARRAPRGVEAVSGLRQGYAQVPGDSRGHRRVGHRRAGLRPAARRRRRDRGRWPT